MIRKGGDSYFKLRIHHQLVKKLIGAENTLTFVTSKNNRVLRCANNTLTKIEFKCCHTGFRLNLPRLVKGASTLRPSIFTLWKIDKKLPRLTRSHIRCEVPYPWSGRKVPAEYICLSTFRGANSETSIALRCYSPYNDHTSYRLTASFRTRLAKHPAMATWGLPHRL